MKAVQVRWILLFEELRDEYLLTLNDAGRDEYYGTGKELAEDELQYFLDWVLIKYKGEDK